MEKRYLMVFTSIYAGDGLYPVCVFSYWEQTDGSSAGNRVYLYLSLTSILACAVYLLISIPASIRHLLMPFLLKSILSGDKYQRNQDVNYHHCCCRDIESVRAVSMHNWLITCKSRKNKGYELGVVEHWRGRRNRHDCFPAAIECNLPSTTSITVCILLFSHACLFAGLREKLFEAVDLQMDIVVLEMWLDKLARRRIRARDNAHSNRMVPV